MLFDTSTLTLIREDAKDPDAEICREFFTELIKANHQILIPAVALAEYLAAPPHQPPKRHRSIDIVAFDDEAAIAMSELFPGGGFQQIPGMIKRAVKYDTTSIATAVRHRAEMIFCRDEQMAKRILISTKLQVKQPKDFPLQLPLLDEGIA